MSKKLLLSGYYGFDNSGDDAILRAIVDNLKKLNPDFEITALSKSPEKTSKEYSIESVDRFSIKQVYSAMKNTDMFVFGGGSLLQDVTSTRSLWYYLSLIWLALILKKKIFVFANGIGPIDKKLNRFLTKIILNKVDYITVRDQGSFSYLKFIGITNPNVKITADPVFSLVSSSEKRALEILEENNINLKGRVIGISIRDWFSSPDLTREIAKFCDKFIGEDIDFLIVPMHYPHDVNYSNTIRILSRNERIHLIENKYPVEDLISVLSLCDIVYAMRLHALIYAAKAERPIVGLIYDPKVTGLIDELSVSEYIRVEDVTSDNLMEAYKNLNDNIEDRKLSIQRANRRQEELAKETLLILEKVLNE